ncbi:MAG: sensor histidine kinase [Gemmatimonadales bacterium]|nr:MAG: sensor histidine kinase [Gemmatimonadales bacterium]
MSCPRTTCRMTEPRGSPAASLEDSAAAARQYWNRRYPGTITGPALDASLRTLVEAAAGPPGSPLPEGLRSPSTLLHVRRELLDCLRRSFVDELQRPGRDPGAPGAGDAIVRQMARFEEVRDALDPRPDEQVGASLSGPHAHEILAEVGHDLRSPLTSVLFLSETLRDSPGIRDDAQQVRQLSMIYSGALTMLNVVNNFMELSESRDGQVEADPTVFSVQDLLESTRRTVQPMADAKGLALRTRMELAHSDRRRGHPTVLTRILLNLTTNAVKFTRDGEVRIEAREWDPGIVEILVEDTGPGIDSAREEAIFDVFEPAQDRHGVRFIGSGLGLVIVRRLLATLESELVCDSTVGEGTRMSFRVRLPNH